MVEIPRLMIVAPYSGAGKTTITLSILAALMKRGTSPVAYKCGPDYIDPMFHREILGVPSYNLDLFFTDQETTRGLFCKHARDHGIAIMEGVMGYYDGIGWGTEASSYELARTTQTPVILVVSAKGASFSIAAIIKGFAELRKPSFISGVIINNCSEHLYRMLKFKLEEETGLPMLGFFPHLEQCSVKSRHLGLVTAAELDDLRDKLNYLGHQAEKCIDLNGLLEIGRSANKLDGRLPAIQLATLNKPRVAVAQDEAFCFYYADNLTLLRQLGAEIVSFSPLKDRVLPQNISALYLGGGYPELYVKKLGENTSMLKSIRSAVEDGLPTFAEGGGFLYLHHSLEDENGTAYPMVGVFNSRAYKTQRLQQFGYIKLIAQYDNLLCQAGEAITAHEFHYWNSSLKSDACIARKPDGREWLSVFANESIFAGFPHLYFYNNPNFAVQFVKAAAAYKTKAVNQGKAD
jgi:cobyrinic acid a,c-diamide synthase